MEYLSDKSSVAKMDKNLEKISPFELKNRLIEMADESVKKMVHVMLNAGRGNPNWIATEAREAFFILGSFAIAESRRVMDMSEGIAGIPLKEGIAQRFELWLTEYFAQKSRLGNSKKLYAHVRKHLVEVYCYDKGKLLLINSFPCKQTADCIYYLLYIWQQLGYNQEKDELQLTGKFKDKEGLLTGLRKYLRQVFIINPKAEFNRSEISKIEDIPFDMQTLILCE